MPVTHEELRVLVKFEALLECMQLRGEVGVQLPVNIDVDVNSIDEAIQVTDDGDLAPLVSTSGAFSHEHTIETLSRVNQDLVTLSERVVFARCTRDAYIMNYWLIRCLMTRVVAQNRVSFVSFLYESYSDRFDTDEHPLKLGHFLFQAIARGAADVIRYLVEATSLGSRIGNVRSLTNNQCPFRAALDSNRVDLVRYFDTKCCLMTLDDDDDQNDMSTNATTHRQVCLCWFTHLRQRVDVGAVDNILHYVFNERVWTPALTNDEIDELILHSFNRTHASTVIIRWMFRRFVDSVKRRMVLLFYRSFRYHRFDITHLLLKMTSPLFMETYAHDLCTRAMAYGCTTVVLLFVHQADIRIHLNLDDILASALRHGHFRIARYLIERHREHVDWARNIELYACNAIASCNLDMCRWFFDTYVAHSTHANLYLTLAFEHGTLSIFKYLTSSYWPPSKLDIGTLIVLATRRRYLDMVDFLLDTLTPSNDIDCQHRLRRDAVSVAFANQANVMTQLDRDLVLHVIGKLDCECCRGCGGDTDDNTVMPIHDLERCVETMDSLHQRAVSYCFSGDTSVRWQRDADICSALSNVYLLVASNFRTDVLAEAVSTDNVTFVRACMLPHWSQWISPDSVNELLTRAARFGCANVTACLLDEFGADVHVSNDYALRWASRLGKVSVVHCLLRHGADPTRMSPSRRRRYCAGSRVHYS